MDDENEKTFHDSLEDAVNEQLELSKKAIPEKRQESITPQIVNSWQHSIESLGNSVKEIAEIYFESKAEEGEREERMEAKRLDVMLREFRMRFWAALAIFIIGLGAIVWLVVYDKGQTLIPFLVGIITLAGNFLFKDIGLFTRQNKPTENARRKEA